MTTQPATAAASSGKKRKLVNVHLLNGDEHLVNIDVKAKFQEVFNQVVGHLSIRETEYFGLAFKKDDEYHFILLDEKVHKLAPKQWKSGPGEGLDSQGKALINVWFRIQYYVDQVILLREKVTRHQYYLQLKENVVLYNHLYNEEKCLQLAAYALQADHGSFIAEKHESGYFNPTLYFPHWMIERHGIEYLAKNVPTIHKDLHGMTRNDAELRYIRIASSPPGAHNLHLYTVRKRKSDKVGNTWLAVCARGVEVFEDDAGYKNHISTFLWKDIGKLYFDKKKFEIRSVQSAGGRRFMYYTDCDIKSKYLLNIARGTHMFQMAIQPKLMEIQHFDNEDQKRYRESYIYSDGRDRRHLQHSSSKSASAAGSSCNQRYSLISDASSNTTSGIVSDRMAVSFDEGDDHSRDIVGPSPSPSSGTPSQPRSKFQLLSGYKQSPQSNKTSPIQAPRSLELFKSSDGKTILSQELSPTSSNGSWRARHVSNPACLKGASSGPLPSPTTSQDAGLYSAVRRSGGRKGSFSKQYGHGSLLMSGDRNTSGDSAVSVSGIFSGSDKLAPLSLPPLEHQVPISTATGASPNVAAMGSSRGANGVATNFSLTPPLVLGGQVKKKTGRSPPSSLNFSPGMLSKESPSEQYRSRTSPRGIGHYSKPASSPRELNEKLSTLTSPRANIPEQYSSPRSKTLPHVLDKSETAKTHGSPRDVGTSDVFKFQYTPRKYQSSSPGTDALFSAQANKLQVNLPASKEGDHDQKEDGSSYNKVNTILPTADQMHTMHAAQYQQQQQQQHLLSQQILLEQQQIQFAQPFVHYHQHQQQLPPSAPHYPMQPQHTIQSQQQQFAHHQQAYYHQQQQNAAHPRTDYSEASPRQPTEQYIVADGSELQTLQHQQAPTGQPPDYPTAKQSTLQDMPTKSEGFPQISAGASLDTDYALKQEQYELLLQYQQSQMQSRTLHQHPQVHFNQLAQQQSKQNTQLAQAHQESGNNELVKELKKTQQEQSYVLDSEAVQEMEENKENLFHSAEKREERTKELAIEAEQNSSSTSSGRKQQNPRGKGNLHPELKHILGQSHAISLPLITALCNDSTLMQDSRSQSGSRSSYDTSTVRSTDSRLTRLSHDTDSRRWSSCCQAGTEATSPEMKLSTSSGRPYSWHSEHFELDSQLSEAVDTTSLHLQDIPATTPPNPRAAVTNKHLDILDSKTMRNHNALENGGGSSGRPAPNSYLLPPQKMIESDPGPSSPRRAVQFEEGTSWWDSPIPVTGLNDPQAASWADVIPYRLPIHQHMLAQGKRLLRNSGAGSTSSQHHQQMVPHRLNSGGHRDSDSSISHKQIMKENIGIA